MHSAYRRDRRASISGKIRRINVGKVPLAAGAGSDLPTKSEEEE
jgi:hypothetical protein